MICSALGRRSTPFSDSYQVENAAVLAGERIHAIICLVIARYLSLCELSCYLQLFRGEQAEIEASTNESQNPDSMDAGEHMVKKTQDTGTTTESRKQESTLDQQ